MRGRASAACSRAATCVADDRPSVDSLFARRGSVDGGGGGRGARRPSLDDANPEKRERRSSLAELFGWDSNKEAPKN